jgi:hypothetical protein
VRGEGEDEDEDEDEEEDRRGPSIEELRYREDGFTPAKRKKFLKCLRKTGCVADAARVAGISTTTIARLRRKFADFDAQCLAARELAVPGLEAIAYQRATVGAAEKVIRKGELVEVRVKPSDAMLRLLLTGAAPRKYGRYAGLKRAKRGDAKRGRDKWKRRRSLEEVHGSILRKIEAINRKHLASGKYVEGPGGMLVPAGWRMVGEEELTRLGWTPPEGETALPQPVLPGPSVGEGCTGSGEGGGEPGGKGEAGEIVDPAMIDGEAELGIMDPGARAGSVGRDDDQAAIDPGAIVHPGGIFLADIAALGEADSVQLAGVAFEPEDVVGAELGSALGDSVAEAVGAP